MLKICLLNTEIHLTIFLQKQYAPSIIKADEVWDNNTGGLTGVKDTIVVAVLDLGMFAGHEDLKDNIWKNYADKPGDKIDNDGNGYIDDHSGLDIATKTDALNSHYHGTGVAGIIGAKVITISAFQELTGILKYFRLLQSDIFLM